MTSKVCPNFAKVSKTLLFFKLESLETYFRVRLKRALDDFLFFVEKHIRQRHFSHVYPPEPGV